MPLPQPVAKPSALPPDLDPKKVPAGTLVRRLIDRGKMRHKVVDFPRFDDLGEPVCKVAVRLLTVREQDEALANARLYVERLLSGGKKADSLEWRPEELEHNARITEILAIACREPDDLSKPFFEHGAVEARQHCTSEELGGLANVYAGLMAEHPKLGGMSDAEIESFLRAVEEGTLSDPFSFCSRETLETLLSYCVRSWIARAATSTGPSPTSTSPSA